MQPTNFIIVALTHLQFTWTKSFVKLHIKLSRNIKYNVIVGVEFSLSPILHLFQDAPLLSFLGAINGNGSCNFAAKLPKVLPDYWRSVSNTSSSADIVGIIIEFKKIVAVSTFYNPNYSLSGWSTMKLLLWHKALFTISNILEPYPVHRREL